MNDLFDILEICLNEIENGADLETVLARYPDQAGELRPILKTAVQARNASVPEPSPEAIRRGRSRVMQRAAEMREVKASPRKRVIPAFQRLAISFSLAALLLMSSTGLLNASASALPGENLYPVKRGWENIRLLLVFDQQARKLLEFEFENERLYEVSALLSEGRDEPIQFAGIFMQVGRQDYVSGVPVLLPSAITPPALGTAVIVSGRTNAQGIVEILSLNVMASGALVPEGKPVEAEIESGTGPGGEAMYEIQGILDAVSANSIVIEDITVYLDNPAEDWNLCIGMLVEVKGYYAADGRFIALEVEGKGGCEHDQTVPSANEDSSDDSNENTIVNENGADVNSNDENSNDGNGNTNFNENTNGNENSDHTDSNSNDSNDSNDNSGGNLNENDSSGNDNSGGGSQDNNDSVDDNSGGGSDGNDNSGGDDSGTDDNDNSSDNSGHGGGNDND
ncbi:MAG TPA: DUF5667 domain-containing protein [Anaerolineales bacterium]|nr:DUF5667 domain-containing protein [Anaerolineales bacterium]